VILVNRQARHLSKKVFEPITTKLGDVVASNLKIPPMRRRTKKKEAENGGHDYAPEVDPYEDMDAEGLINFGDYVPPEQEKQIIPKPPTYEESLKDVLEGKKEIYVDPQYLPPEYDHDEVPAFEIADEGMANKMLDDIGVTNNDDVEMRLNQPEMTPQKNIAYLDKIIKDAEFRRKQLKGYQSAVTKQLKSGVISEAEGQDNRKRIQNANVVSGQYINYYKTKVKTMKGSGIRKQKGGNVMFFNDPKHCFSKN